MLRQMLEKGTKARCVWVSKFSKAFEIGEIDLIRKLIVLVLVHGWLSKLKFKIDCYISGWSKKLLYYGGFLSTWTFDTGKLTT